MFQKHFLMKFLIFIFFEKQNQNVISADVKNNTWHNNCFLKRLFSTRCRKLELILIDFSLLRFKNPCKNITFYVQIGDSKSRHSTHEKKFPKIKFSRQNLGRK